jgi:hypothetical protein
MKKLLLGILLFVSSLPTYAQTKQDCDLSILYKKAMAQIDTGYIYTKSFKLRPTDKAVVDNTIVMTAGKSYHLYVESADTDPHYGIMVQLRDETDKKIIASNFDANNKIMKHIIHFTCTKTGIYHLILDYSRAKTHCGVAVMSFRKEPVDTSRKTN